ncbi:MAG: tRNA uridine(34) 5-carboxymethylaminomethyl modification radical SAM/GNAT enzyme Elp3 [Coriobacteriia bacterium]|nr:tRNA uridine(34) 5-carboxymethylaminomethyl modification radical SAM/GNAT enzyme Elp3 [Coriobacteriia bacterium]
MEEIILDILDTLRETDRTDEQLFSDVIGNPRRKSELSAQPPAKRKVLAYYQRVRGSDPERWASWNIDPVTEKRLLQVLQVKRRRTASGVATITVITKPWKCSGACLYCPNDVRMPKSYLSDEPACQRAERNYFDPYLQVASRLRALTQMGHITDKVELIVLGGTWSDYPAHYQTWFISELFRALSDGDTVERNAQERRQFYQNVGLSNQREELMKRAGDQQQAVDSGTLTYNQAIERLYTDDEAWRQIAAFQTATTEELLRQHVINETAAHRVVGLVIETRPDAITADCLALLRQVGCTKIQMGIQSLDPALLRLNHRAVTTWKIREAFELLRAFGFKTHVHFMLNLLGATPAADIADYARLVTDPAYLPDEVKLYPCSLVKGTELRAHYADGSWRPYSAKELLDVLTSDTLVTPPFTRISRMIRDISAHDIVAGNRKANLRQLVEQQIKQAGGTINEIRYREIAADEVDLESLTYEAIPYATTTTNEYFLQWVTPENRIAGFLRLSLPLQDYLCQHQAEFPVAPGEAMIREVHVYGKVAALDESGGNAQHLGLGRRLVEAATDIARGQGYSTLNVISSVGTREYYRGLGFSDHGLYQQRNI